MEWEYEIMFRIGHLALLRKKEKYHSKGKRRWQLGWNRKYESMDGVMRRSWGVVT